MINLTKSGWPRFKAASEGATATLRAIGEAYVEAARPSNALDIYNMFEAARKPDVNRAVFASAS
ncbi:hypothetical protein B6U99_02225 [Candidatus Geothermarchaeota archaeon ex4572_27]|nr:MAG: hypothetical protein B6U99_02225 [Candidatus Geothermarchaeota archaeon ex4572_27]